MIQCSQGGPSTCECLIHSLKFAFMGVILPFQLLSARENSKAFVLGMFARRVAGAVWVEDECSPHTLTGMMEPGALNKIIEGKFNTTIPVKGKESQKLEWKGFHLFAR